MKKKILLCLCIVAMLICLFAISASASDLAYDRVYTIGGVEYPLWEQDAEGNYHPLMWYKDGENLLKVYADNTDSTKAPYVTYTKWVDSKTKEMKTVTITDAAGKTFGGKETVVIANLHNIYLRDGDNGQITQLNKTAFQGSTVLKAVYLPESVNLLGYTGSNGNFVPFQGCTALEYAEIAPSAQIKTISANAFMNCTALKAVSLPDGITKLDQVSFAGCTSLQAVYLPSNLEECQYNGWDKGAFYNCSSAYLVNEAFVIENIATDIPAKPDVYYFPANFKAIGDAFRDWKNINNTLVFGDKLTVVDYNGFTNTGVSGETKTAVFTGVMTKFYLGDTIQPTWSFVFTNTTDESIFSTRTDRGYANSTGYLCKTNREVLFHYGVKWSDGDSTHFADVRKSDIQDATCVTNETAVTYCFCGTKIGTSPTEGTALGHEFDLEKGATKLSVVYTNYLAKGTLNTKCARCEECSESDVAPIISSFKGYSIKEDGNGITFGYTIDYAALDEFAKINGKKVDLGFVVAAQSKVTDNKPLNADGSVVNANVVKASVVTWSNVDSENEKTVKYSGADFKLTGDFTGLENVVLCMAGYLFDGAVAYLNLNASGDSADYITYGELVTVTE